jgi:hypothetical protein
MVWAGKRARSPTGSSPSSRLPSATVPISSLPTRGWAPLPASPAKMIGQSRRRMMLRKLRPLSLSRSRLHQQRPHSFPPATLREPHPHPLLRAKRRKLHLPSSPRKLRRRLRPRPIPHAHHRHSLPPATLLATPLPLSTPGVAGIDPLDRYERRALSRRNRAVQKFMEMIARTACQSDARRENWMARVPAAWLQSSIEIS